MVAAIGVSGSTSEQMDEDCARVGLAKIGDRVKSLPSQKYLTLELAQDAAQAAVAFCKSIKSGAAAVVAMDDHARQAMRTAKNVACGLRVTMCQTLPHSS